MSRIRSPSPSPNRSTTLVRRPIDGLDAGTGLGPYRSHIAALGHRCLGEDLSLEMLRVGLANNRGVWSVQGDVRLLPCRDNAFDWVLATRLLSNLPSPASAFREFARVMKTGAECLITDVHPDHPYSEMSVRIDDRVINIETYKRTTNPESRTPNPEPVGQ
jgi:ubiquinone/menaquinone biosynthesis C-methylase UbiE